MADKMNGKSTQAQTEIAKKALSHFGGPAGKIAAGLANTKAGQAAMNKMVNNNPGGLVNPARNLNLINAARKAKANNESSDSLDGGKSDGELGDTDSNGLDSSLDNSASSSSLDGSIDSKDSKSAASGAGTINTNKKKNLIMAIGGAALAFGGTIIVIVLVISIIYSAADVMKEVWDGIVGFFTKDQQELEQEYYDKLREVQKNRYKKKNVCIDVNLITAALTVDTTFEPDPNEESTTVLDEDDEAADTNPDAKKGALDYKRMKKQIELLANMQIKTRRPGTDTRMASYPGNVGGKCLPYGNNDEEELVTEDNKEYYNPPGIIFEQNGRDSSSPELVAMHDASPFKAFFTKKYNEEENNEYVIIRPAAKRRCTEGTLSDGSCKDGKYTDYCDIDTEKTYELSIGDASNPLNTMKDGVFYWNLINSFIEDYYDEYLPEDEEARDLKKQDIAESIFLLYKSMGPSHECDMYKIEEEEDDDNENGRKGWSDSDLCPDGIMVQDSNGTITTHYLEEYVAGVVAAENNWREGENIENMKAQAIAARSFALARTGNCSRFIKNGQTDQAYRATDDPYIIRAVQETAGVVLRKSDGSILSAQYDAFCVTSNTGNDYIISQKSQAVPKDFANNNGAGWNYTNCLCNQSSVFTRDKYPKCWILYKGKWSYFDGGHGAGMSQIGSRYLQHIGNDHQQILKYYYGDGINIDDSKKGTGVGGAAGPWDTWRQKDPAPWAGLEMPNPSTWVDKNGKVHSCTHIRNCGCAIVSVAIQIARSGVSTSLGANFDPGTFYQAMKSAGGFSGNGIIWDAPRTTGIAPSFILSNIVDYTGISQVRKYISDGYYIVASVNDNGHYIALTDVVGEKITMVDPARDSTDALAVYGSLNRLILYRIGN